MRRERLLFESRQPVGDALVNTRAEQLNGRDDVELFECGQARQQIEVRLVESTRFGDPVADRQNHAANRHWCSFINQALAERVLVAPAGGGEALLVAAERRGEVPRLAEHPLGATVEFGIPLERLFEEGLEAIDPL